MCYVARFTSFTLHGLHRGCGHVRKTATTFCRPKASLPLEQLENTADSWTRYTRCAGKAGSAMLTMLREGTL